MVGLTLGRKTEPSSLGLYRGCAKGGNGERGGGRHCRDPQPLRLDPRGLRPDNLGEGYLPLLLRRQADDLTDRLDGLVLQGRLVA